MPVCPTIHNLKLDARSKQDIERIRQIQTLSNSLASSIAFGSMFSMFAGNGPKRAAYNISQHDWAIWADAMRAVPDIARNRVRQEAQLQILDHLMDVQQQRFWRAIESGCQVAEVMQ